MASATATKTTPRERGTLKHTLPRKPIILIALVGLISATLAAQLMTYSVNDTSDDDSPIVVNVQLSWWGSFGVALMGTVEVLVGIVFGESVLHSLTRMMIIMLPAPAGLRIFTNAKSSIKAALPPYIFLLLSSTKAAEPALERLATTIYLPTVLQSILLLQSLTFIIQYATLPSTQFSFLPIFTVTIITLTLLQAYIHNRSHKNGSLLPSQSKHHAILNCAAQTLSSLLLYQAYPTTTLKFLSGSLITILICAFFASISDVWYTVGSGQFQMCSLDSAGLGFYFILPVGLLYSRFLNQHGGLIGGYVCEWIDSLVNMTGVQVGSGMDDTLIFILSVATSLGVPIINVLCPMGGYLFARSYTHGQPNTKKVAICVNCADLPADSKALLDTVDGKDVALNIYVTLEDMQSHFEELRVLSENGHYIALAPGSDGNSLDAAFEEFANIFEEEAGWTLASPNRWSIRGTNNSRGRHPTYLRKAHDLGMKVAYWSTLVVVDGERLSKDQETYIVDDVADKNGGSIIYIMLEKGATTDTLTNALSTIVDLLKDFSLCPLPEVVKDDSTMVL